MVCSICIQIFNGNRPTLWADAEDPLNDSENAFEAQRREDACARPLHHDISELCIGALDGCHICDIVWRHFFKEKSPQEYLAQPYFESGQFRHVFTGSGTHYRLRVPDTVSRQDVSEDTIELEVGLNSPMNKLIPKFKSLFLVPLDGEQHKSMTEQPLPDSNIYSNQTWSIIQRWFAECTEGHTKCNLKSTDTRWYPTRLLKIWDDRGEDNAIHIKSSIEVQLIETSYNPPTGPYMTLSHRWNDSINIKTEESNINLLKQRFSADLLSPTFFEAILLTLKLGIHYIWIDSLCIIQNNENDWNYEALTMGKVYSYSALNLSATAAMNALITPRDPRLIQPCIIQSNWTGLNSQPLQIMNSQFWGDRIHRSVCNTRGWITQERWLAPRVLHFAFDQLVWECREQTAAETYPAGLPKEIMRYGRRDFKQDNKTISPGEGVATPQALLHRDWCDVLDTYGRAELTKESDRLVAIAGVAEVFAEKFHDDWLAGLWRRTLPGDLLWAVSKSWRSNKPRSDPAGLNITAPQNWSSRLESYQAPSWSWASVHGDISAGTYVNQESKEAMITIVGISIIPLHQDKPLGRLKSASLRLRGTLYPLAMDPPDWQEQYDKSQRERRMEPLPPRIYITGLGKKLVSAFGGTFQYQSHSHVVSIQPDQPEDYSDVAKCCFLPVRKLVYDNPGNRFHGKHIVTGLCLMPTGGKQGEYRRLGLVQFGDEESALFEDGLEVLRGSEDEERKSGHPPTLQPDLYEDGVIYTFSVI